jgi:hypothetical protein
MNNSAAGNSKDDHIYENRAYGIIERKEDHAYVEYDDKRREKEEDGWWSLCLACFLCK